MSDINNAIITLTFKREKFTKNTAKYAEVERPGQPPVLGQIYVQKWFALDTPTLTITVSRV